MIDLIKADLYKEIRKKSFKFSILLVMFVSILSLVVINKNMNLKNEETVIYPLYSEEEYKSVNKYGDYQQYVKEYDNYVKVVDIENELKNRNNVSKLRNLLGYSHSFIFLLGVVVIVLSFHSFSYDYQKDTIKYVFMSRQGRKKIFFSKLISMCLLTLFLLLLLLFIMIITSGLLTGENIFTMRVWINNNSFKEVSFLWQFIKNSFVYFVPLFFMIVFSMFFSILFKGSNFGLIISGIVYFAGLMFSQILFNYGIMFVKYSFLPYIDFTYLVDTSYVKFNNLIYNLDFSYCYSVVILLIYSLLFIIVSLKLLKRDV